MYFASIENGHFSALVPIMEVNSFLTGKRGVSLPFTDYCEPIINGSVEFVELFNSLIEYGKKRGWKYLELRGGDKLFSNLEPRTLNLEPVPSSLKPESWNLNPPAGSLNPGTFSSNLQSAIRIPQSEGPKPCSDSFSLTPYTLHPTPCPYVTYLGHTLDLTKGEKALYSGLRDSTRRNIKKALKEGVVVKIFNSLESVKEFCRLNCMTRKKHGLPPQPYRFFRKVYDHIISKGLGFITLTSHNGQNIAGAVFFHFGNTAVFKYGASDNKYQHLRANNLVMWEAIKWYCQNDYKSLSLGRTDPENQGLAQFKSGWGGKQENMKYFKYDLGQRDFINEGSKNSSFFNPVFTQMPVFLSRLISSVFYKHAG